MKNLYAALLAAQHDMGPLYKDATNPHFRSNYATLANVLEVLREPLLKNGLVAIHSTSVDADGQPVQVLTVAHAESGESFQSIYPLRAKNLDDPQQLGSASTYARRYSLLGFFGLAPQEDDDGNAASGKASTPSKPKATTSRSTSSGGTTKKTASAGSPNEPASDAQKNWMQNLAKTKFGITQPDAFRAQVAMIIEGKELKDLSKADASRVIDAWKELPDKGKKADEPGY